MFRLTWQKILTLDLIHQSMMLVDHYPQERIIKVIRLMNNKLGIIIIKQILVLTQKMYSHLIDYGCVNKKQREAKGTKIICNKTQN